MKPCKSASGGSSAEKTIMTTSGNIPPKHHLNPTEVFHAHKTSSQKALPVYGIYKRQLAKCHLHRLRRLSPFRPYLLWLSAESRCKGKPVLFPISRLQELTNEEILKDECAGILSRQAFCQLYSKLLLWETDASEPCGIRQRFSASFGPY